MNTTLWGKVMGNLFKKWTSLSKLQMILFSSIAAVLIIGIIVLIFVLNTGYFAKSMRLLNLTGYVTLIDETGSETTLYDNMRFASGQSISTGVDSSATIGFDDNKIVTLQANSRATFNKSGKRMELVVDEGGIFFEVNKPLQGNESFDIRTSTMICGIRGTSGYVYVDGEGNSNLVLTSGRVHITGLNPTNGVTRELDVTPGQRLTVYVTPSSVEFELFNVTPENLTDEHIRHIYSNSTLLDTVCQATGWDVSTIRNIVYNVYGANADDLLADPEAVATATTSVREVVEATETVEVVEVTEATTAATTTARANNTNSTTAATTTVSTTSATTTATETIEANTPTPTPTVAPVVNPVNPGHVPEPTSSHTTATTATTTTTETTAETTETTPAETTENPEPEPAPENPEPEPAPSGYSGEESGSGDGDSTPTTTTAAAGSSEWD